MVRIRMKQDEIISWGPVRLLMGDEIDVPDAVAASLLGRGLADLVEPPEGKSETVSDLTTETTKENADLSFNELRAQAKEAQIAGYSRMNKAELVEVLSDDGE